MRLFHDNKIDLATLTPSSENANYPASNLKDTRLSRKWRTTGDEDESLVIAAGGEALEVFQATDNIVLDREDLTTANWTTLAVGSTPELSDEYYDGKRFTKVPNDGAAPGYVRQDETTTWTTLTPSLSVIVKKGNSVGNTTSFYILTAVKELFKMPIAFDNYPNAPGVPADGILHGYEWKDSETLEIRIICAPLDALADDVQIRCYGSTNATADEYTYWTAVQAEDLPYPTPYVDGIRAAAHPNESFIMLSQFVLDMVARPWFTFDTATDHMYASYYIDVTHRLIIVYRAATKKMTLWFVDGTNVRIIESQEFDDGTAEVDINQRIRILASIYLTTGTNLGSRFIVIPLESGAIEENTVWSGAIDAHISTFPTLGIGHQNDAAQADSRIEYIRIYEGTLIGTVGDSDDADALLTEKELILDLTYLDKITANHALLAGHNLTAGASIKLQGNNYDAWNGVPFEEDMTWDSATIVHAFTEATYPYWRLLIDDPNNPDEYIKIGRPYLGTYYQVLETFDKNFTEEPFNTDVSRYSKSGQLYSRRGYDGRAYSLNFPYWENTVKQAIDDIMATVGKRKPFFLMLDENNLDVLPILYCHIPKDIAYNHLVGYKWTGSLSFREVK